MIQAESTGALRLSYRLALGFTLGAVLLGSAVCATESGLACPSWPGCFPGQPTPDGVHSAIEFTHRVVAFGSLVFLGLAAWRGRGHPDLRVRRFPLVALVAAVASGVFGMMIVLFSLPLLLGLLDVAAAMVALCLVTAATVRLEHGTGASPDRLSRLGWGTVAVVMVMHLLGIVVAGPSSLVRCLGWPVWRIVDTDGPVWLQWTRLVVAAVAMAMLALLVVRAWRRSELRGITAGLVLAWLVELVLGQLIVGQFAGDPRHLGLAGLYSMLAGLVLWLIALVAARAATPATGGRPDPVRDQRPQTTRPS